MQGHREDHQGHPGDLGPGRYLAQHEDPDHLRTVGELEPILDRFTPYGRTTTSLIQSMPVPRRPLPLEDPLTR